MNPQHKDISDNVRTEELPAQERVAAGGESGPALSADQVYAQRLVETPSNGDISNPTFIP
jgi:hypothetical protein